MKGSESYDPVDILKVNLNTNKTQGFFFIGTDKIFSVRIKLPLRIKTISIKKLVKGYFKRKKRPVFYK